MPLLVLRSFLIYFLPVRSWSRSLFTFWSHSFLVLTGGLFASTLSQKLIFCVFVFSELYWIKTISSVIWGMFVSFWTFIRKELNTHQASERPCPQLFRNPVFHLRGSTRHHPNSSKCLNKGNDSNVVNLVFFLRLNLRLYCWLEIKNFIFQASSGLSKFL